MEFVDATLLRLADVDNRGGLFDETSLEQMLRATYDTASLGAEGPYQAAFERVSFAFDDAPVSVANGHFSTAGAHERSELVLQWASPAPGASTPRIDALCTFAIVATARRSGDRVQRVDVAWTSLAGIDGEIVPLPTDPRELELARRARLMARIRSHLDQPGAFDDAAMSRWMQRMNASTVAELLVQADRAERGATLRLVFEPAPAPADKTRQSLSVFAAFLIRPTGVSIATLLDETRQVRARLERQSVERAPPSSPKPRFSTTIVWVLPSSVFDDAGWPGSQAGLSATEARTRRRAWAGRWLAGEGIGLLVPPS